MQTLTFGEDAPSYVTGLAKYSVIGSIALSALSNAAIIADECSTARYFPGCPEEIVKKVSGMYWLAPYYSLKSGNQPKAPKPCK